MGLLALDLYWAAIVADFLSTSAQHEGQPSLVVPQQQPSQAPERTRGSGGQEKAVGGSEARGPRRCVGAFPSVERVASGCAESAGLGGAARLWPARRSARRSRTAPTHSQAPQTHNPREKPRGAHTLARTNACARLCCSARAEHPAPLHASPFASSRSEGIATPPTPPPSSRAGGWAIPVALASACCYGERENRREKEEHTQGGEVHRTPTCGRGK